MRVFFLFNNFPFNTERKTGYKEEVSTNEVQNRKKSERQGDGGNCCLDWSGGCNPFYFEPKGAEGRWLIADVDVSQVRGRVDREGVNGHETWGED